MHLQLSNITPEQRAAGLHYLLLRGGQWGLKHLAAAQRTPSSMAQEGGGCPGLEKVI